MIVSFAKSFQKIYKNLDPALKKKVNKQITFLINNPRHPSLKFKKYDKDIYQAYVDRKHRMLGILKGNELKLFDLFNK